MKGKLVDINQQMLEKYLESIRPSEKIRDELDIGYSYDGVTVELFEIRPQWNVKDQIMHIPYAKIKYIKSKKVWKLYWMRANGHWAVYDPCPQCKYLKKALTLIDEDSHACFKG